MDAWLDGQRITWLQRFCLSCWVNALGVQIGAIRTKHTWVFHLSAKVLAIMVILLSFKIYVCGDIISRKIPFVTQLLVEFSTFFGERNVSFL